ncbi:peptidase [Gardnerella sp. KA00288]|uniref:peptidase n=1 Tax=Gardnerella sp. KA00288 TaxID=2749074 RepID=UPI003BAC6C7E
MFNKKAIAALAAGATLVSGLAFAAPAMADGDQTAPKTDQTAPKADQGKAPAAGEQGKAPAGGEQGKAPAAGEQGKAPAAGDEATYDKSFYKTEDSQALADRLNKEKKEKEEKAKAEDEKDKYEHSPFGNKDMDYKKCVKLYGKDSLECKAVADYLKRHGQKVDDKTNDKKSDKKAEAKKAAPLAKTGAAVALAAVAASVLAGMGVALRKIRH